MQMKGMITIVAALLIAGAVLAMIQHNEREARNKAAIERTIQAVKDPPARSPAGQDARFRERIDKSRAGARFRQSQQR